MTTPSCESIYQHYSRQVSNYWPHWDSDTSYNNWITALLLDSHCHDNRITFDERVGYNCHSLIITLKHWLQTEHRLQSECRLKLNADFKLNSETIWATTVRLGLNHLVSSCAQPTTLSYSHIVMVTSWDKQHCLLSKRNCAEGHVRKTMCLLVD